MDENGEPLVVWHGTPRGNFTVFDKSKTGSTTNRQNVKVGGLGFYFTNDRSAARNYAEYLGSDSNPRTMGVYLNLKNPLVLKDSGWGSAADQADARKDDLARWAKEGGHDGIIVQSTDEILENGMPDTVYIVFSPNQIKSATDNVGTFDGANPDIRFQRGETGRPAAPRERLEAAAAALERALPGVSVVISATPPENMRQGLKGNERALADLEGKRIWLGLGKADKASPAHEGMHLFQALATALAKTGDEDARRVVSNLAAAVRACPAAVLRRVEKDYGKRPANPAEARKWDMELAALLAEAESDGTLDGMLAGERSTVPPGARMWWRKVKNLATRVWQAVRRFFGHDMKMGDLGAMDPWEMFHQVNRMLATGQRLAPDTSNLATEGGILSAANGRGTPQAPSEETRKRFAENPETSNWRLAAEPSAVAAIPAKNLPETAPVCEATGNGPVRNAIRRLFRAWNMEAEEAAGKTGGEAGILNVHTGERVLFNPDDAGKMMMQSGVDMRRFAPHMRELFTGAVLAWTESPKAMEDHSDHGDVSEYRQYIAKFDGFTDPSHGIKGPTFVRFTVRVHKGGRHGVHAATVTEVEVLQNKDATPTVPADKLEGRDCIFVDKKLQLFFADLKQEDLPRHTILAQRGPSEADSYVPPVPEGVDAERVDEARAFDRAQVAELSAATVEEVTARMKGETGTWRIVLRHGSRKIVFEEGFASESDAKKALSRQLEAAKRLADAKASLGEWRGAVVEEHGGGWRIVTGDTGRVLAAGYERQDAAEADLERWRAAQDLDSDALARWRKGDIAKIAEARRAPRWRTPAFSMPAEDGFPWLSMSKILRGSAPSMRRLVKSRSSGTNSFFLPTP